jgi:hypothetical protein
VALAQISSTEVAHAEAALVAHVQPKDDTWVACQEPFGLRVVAVRTPKGSMGSPEGLDWRSLLVGGCQIARRVGWTASFYSGGGGGLPEGTVRPPASISGAVRPPAPVLGAVRPPTFALSVVGPLWRSVRLPAIPTGEESAQ